MYWKVEWKLANEMFELKASYHAAQIDAFIEKHGKEYQSVKLIRNDDNVKEWHARNLGMWVSLISSNHNNYCKYSYTNEYSWMSQLRL